MSYSTTIGKFLNLEQLKSVGRKLERAAIGTDAYDLYSRIRANGGSFVGATVGTDKTETVGFTSQKKAYLLRENFNLNEVSLFIEY